MLISATLIVSGDLLDPEEITAKLGVVPHVSRRKGDRRIYRSGKEVVAKFGLWEWRSKDASKTLTIDDHIGRLRNTFEHVFGLLPNLPNAENAWVDIHMVTDSEESVTNVSFLTNTKTISTLRDIGLPIEFTIDIVSPESAQQADD